MEYQEALICGIPRSLYRIPEVFVEHQEAFAEYQEAIVEYQEAFMEYQEAFVEYQEAFVEYQEALVELLPQAKAAQLHSYAATPLHSCTAAQPHKIHGSKNQCARKPAAWLPAATAASGALDLSICP